MPRVASSPASPAALGTINYEIVTAENVGVVASGNVLIMAFIGGVGHFFGPMIGAVLVTFLQSALSSYTQAWLLYFGLFFVIMVMFAPGGIASLIMVHAPAWRAAPVHRVWCRAMRCRALALAVLLAGGVALVEMIYHVETRRARQSVLACSALPLDATQATYVDRGGAGLRGRRARCSRCRCGRCAARGNDINAELHRSGVRMSEAPALELQGVHKSFGRTPIINGVDLAHRARASATPSSARTAPASRRCST